MNVWIKLVVHKLVLISDSMPSTVSVAVHELADTCILFGSCKSTSMLLVVAGGRCSS